MSRLSGLLFTMDEIIELQKSTPPVISEKSPAADTTWTCQSQAATLPQDVILVEFPSQRVLRRECCPEEALLGCCPLLPQTRQRICGWASRTVRFPNHSMTQMTNFLGLQSFHYDRISQLWSKPCRTKLALPLPVPLPSPKAAYQS